MDGKEDKVPGWGSSKNRSLRGGKEPNTSWGLKGQRGEMIEDEIKDVGKSYNLMGNEWLPSFFDSNLLLRKQVYSCTYTQLTVKDKVVSSGWIFSYSLEMASQNANVLCVGW